jgi:dienelactone hydrolase
MAFGFQLPVFDQISEMLCQRGYAVLSYDKRTCGAFNQCAENDYPAPKDNLTTDTLVADVRAAIEFLAMQPNVHGERLFLVGHSQGAKLAVKAMALDARVRASVMLAGNYHPIDDLLEAQIDSSQQRLDSAGVSPNHQRQVLAPVVGMLEELRAAQRGEPGDGHAFLKSWIELDERSPDLVAKLDRPIMSLGGGYDWNVPPSEIEAWRRWFMRIPNNPGHRAEVIPCVTHALNCITEPDPIRLTPKDVGRHVYPEVVQRIAGFFEQLRVAGER